MANLTESFSERELEVLKALAEGLSNHEIADKLFLAPNTVKWYVRQINSKLDTNNRDEIISVAACGREDEQISSNQAFAGFHPRFALLP
jgi:DNA-binding NarL/FixJ family response regulator